jgi:tRNA modification GTPase
MFSTTDTIVAVATPPGRGGIGVVRLAGPDARAIADRLLTHPGGLAPRQATFTRVRLCTGTTYEDVDHVVATYFPAPHSYTGDDIVELSAHGSPVVLRAIVAGAVDRGARVAEPGEFTLRAFLNGRIDLMQAEAVADLVDAVTPLQARAAFDQLEGTLTRTIGEIDAALFDLIARLEASVDFPEEGFHFVGRAEVVSAIDQLLQRTATLIGDARRGRLIREGLQVSIVGRPNVGKSSVFNALVGSSRAIVSEVPGTTRDLVTDSIDLDGFRVTLVDTAGIRETCDAVEAEGVARSRHAVEVADLVLLVVDNEGDDRPHEGVDGLDERTLLIVRNKIDLPGPDRQIALSSNHPSRLPAVSMSARTGAGLPDLRRAIVAALQLDGSLDLRRDRPEITNVRHAALVERAREALSRARDTARAGDGAMSEEFILADLQDARHALEEITGRRAPEDLLAHIFSRFCVGK